jgi:hypothetical protein
VVIKEETLIRDGFGSQPKFRSLIAEWDGEAIGYALFFGSYEAACGFRRASFEQLTRLVLGPKGSLRTKNRAAYRRECRKGFNLGRQKE